MPGISRIHGGVTAEFLLSGYQQTFLKITASNVGTADTGGGTSAITEGNWQKCIRAIQTIATVSWVGPRADSGFLVLVDAPTAQPTGPAYDTDTSPTVAERVKAVIDDIVFGGSATATVVVPGMLAANVS